MWTPLDNPNNEQRDFVLVSVPWVDSQSPLAGPAALKGVIESTGMSCLAVDLNVCITEKIKNHQHFKELQDFYLDGILSEKVEDEIYQDFEDLVDSILTWRPKWVGFSLLVVDTQIAARWIIRILRERAPEVTIVLGGPGCGITGTGTADDFIQGLFNFDLIDYHVSGDAEISLPELLRGNTTYPGINGIPWQYLTSEQLENIIYPDYSDYHFDTMWEGKNVVLSLTASRGCVRNCTFCDYIESHTKFQWRRAENVFGEMLFQQERFGVSKFVFADSLINGNVREFNRLMELMSEHNKANPDKRMGWTSFYIVRNRTSDDERVWQLIEDSGCYLLCIGIEHFSPRVRYHMGKKVDTESITWHMYQAKKHNIKVVGLCLIGYPIETAEDREINLEWLRNNPELGDTIIFSWSSMRIIPNTQIDRRRDELGIKMDPDKDSLMRIKSWESVHYENTLEERARWVAEAVRVSHENGFKVDADVYSQAQARFILEHVLVNEGNNDK